eukprot:409704-Pyramimonas_sp.AAC.1
MGSPREAPQTPQASPPSPAEPPEPEPRADPVRYDPETTLLEHALVRATTEGRWADVAAAAGQLEDLKRRKADVEAQKMQDAIAELESKVTAATASAEWAH